MLPTRARMAGKVRPSWCPHCRSLPGVDCPDTGRTARDVRRIERAAMRRELARGEAFAR